MLLFKNANIITMENDNFKNGFLCVKSGKIDSLGDMADCPKDDGFIVEDLGGKTILPGFIDAHCHVSLWPEGSDECDGNETSSPITPHMRAIDAINPFDEAFSKARAAGITTMCIGPGSTNVLGGQFATLKTYGISVDEMLLNPYAAQKASFGENPKNVFGEKKEAPSTRMAIAALLRETLYRAKDYLYKKEEAIKNNSSDFSYDFVLESLTGVVRGDIPLKCHAHRADDILTAIRIADEFNIKITLEHCTEGYLIADIIKEKGISVVLGPTLGTKSKSELKNQSDDIYKIFYEKNIPFAIMTDHPEVPAHNLPLCAMLATKYGLPEMTSLAAITINAARILGISDRTGSLKRGKDADFIIMSGNPLTLEAEPCAVYIEGRKVF